MVQNAVGHRSLAYGLPLLKGGFGIMGCADAQCPTMFVTPGPSLLCG